MSEETEDLNATRDDRVTLSEIAASVKDLKAAHDDLRETHRQAVRNLNASYDSLHETVSRLEGDHIFQALPRAEVVNPVVSVDIEAETKAIRRIAKYLTGLTGPSQIRVMDAIRSLLEGVPSDDAVARAAFGIPHREEPGLG